MRTLGPKQSYGLGPYGGGFSHPTKKNRYCWDGKGDRSASLPGMCKRDRKVGEASGMGRTRGPPARRLAFVAGFKGRISHCQTYACQARCGTRASAFSLAVGCTSEKGGQVTISPLRTLKTVPIRSGRVLASGLERSRVEHEHYLAKRALHKISLLHKN